jgi:hypothetical protein
MKKTVVSIPLHPGQVDLVEGILRSDAFYHTVCTSRQFGKSTLCVQLLLYFALNNNFSRIMITSPTHQQSAKLYSELAEGVADAAVIRNKNSVDKNITFLNGSIIYFRSVHIYDNLRGYSLDYLLCDEAAMYRDEAFNSVLRPMLQVKGKKCILFSTPKGSNYFRTMYLRGMDENEPRYNSWKKTWRDNPYANLEEIEDAKKTLPENIYNQEYEAIFVDDGGSVFSNTNKIATIKNWVEPNSNDVYYAGIDIAITGDYFVVIVLNRDGDVVYAYRDNRKDMSYMVKQVSSILNKYNCRSTFVETNGIGGGIYDYIAKTHRSVSPFVTTHTTKQEIIEDLMYATQQGEIKIPTREFFPYIIDEMNTFGYSYTVKTRKVSYGAVTGAHDDTVMALAIALHAKKTGLNKGVYTII